MNFFVAVTDQHWYRFLRSRPELDEVNFWQPSGRTQFRALSPGEPLLFKLHYPENAIVGGAFFSHSSIVPVSLAWEAFGEKNGVSSHRQMLTRIGRYLRKAPDREHHVGCIILESPFFFSEEDWIPAPRDWSKNIVQGKTYSTEETIGAELWSEVQLRRQGRILGEASPEDSVYGEPVLVRRRLGQGGFRILVTDTYERRCAVTGEKALPVLDAAHIRPVTDGGGHQVENGLLFRSDIHRLFDRGYVTVTPDRKFLVSRRLKDDFDNGEPYYPYHDQEVWTPKEVLAQPSQEFLEWHGDEVFLG